MICKSCSEYCVLLAEFWQTVDVIAGMQEKEIHQQAREKYISKFQETHHQTPRRWEQRNTI